MKTPVIILPLDGGGLRWGWTCRVSPSPSPSPVRGCVEIPILSLRATEGSVAISEISIPCEIASVVSLPRNDIATQSLKGEGWGSGDLIYVSQGLTEFFYP